MQGAKKVLVVVGAALVTYAGKLGVERITHEDVSPSETRALLAAAAAALVVSLALWFRAFRSR